MRHYEILAPAKTNLTLHVLGRRPDGFHEIASLLVPISLCDRLEVRVGGAAVRVRVPDAPSLEGDDNLCARAARAFASRTGLPAGVDVLLEKRIPVAAGLGGGSSDAGAVLRCLAHAHGLPEDDPALLAAAADVGSDVPFFLRCRPAVARGRGERLEAAPTIPPLDLLVLKPAFGISAGEAYGLLARLRASGDLPGGREVPLPRSLPDPSAVLRLLHNDLETAVERRWPVAPLRERLLACGAAAAMLSGSGSAVVGYFTDREAREKCSKSIRLARGEGLFPARTLQAPPAVRET